MMQPQPARRLYRSRSERRLAGLAGGVAAYFNLDPTLVRLLMVVALLPAGPFAPLVYLLLVLIVPQEPVGSV
ncbi:MAG TPA: PspC domain-containing protein [Thermomicrobiaceae bacterium]|nr:PspC domain-containing protein [Thermomicrobiaceae bacterium]